ncbi:GNAT family N-acetyltransferase [Colwellia sp. D2M02]|uniref:GNAT family N-acetyltransferase n=1 Tax=Colwellia sp. D2M02 TaxID=2841562 RepID=UPI001C091A10|nr:GNAT family N-acetyltransferase [Colwellia sp. D2M02]MBU2895017.1 GNAT family N-acetyltransferase [Colwellia sp. D2M02]
MTNMEASCHISYQTLTFDDFVSRYQEQLPTVKLFELTLPWLMATRDFMMATNDKLVVHCLYSNDETAPQLLIAWPLIHRGKHNKLQLHSLSSFYSAMAEPYYTSDDGKAHLPSLLKYIDKNTTWHSMNLGGFAENANVPCALTKYFKACKLFNETANFYQDNLVDFNSYYQQLPSQLRNTVKRRSKKLAAAHPYNIRIINTLDDFITAFEGYKSIYQQSWKGEEFSFAFIEQVCRAAIAENKLRFGMLYVDNKPAAAQLWFLQSGTASIFKLAYDQQYKNFSVGSILSMALSEHVLEYDKVTCIEFGMGSEPYKKDWLAKQRQRVSYQIFNQQRFLGKIASFRYITLPYYKNLWFSKNNEQ